ncbi:MAG: DUF1254 domain-containing protein [Sphingomonas sp.]|nr:DUF1254 domain-containing protein [Sphingomonas sp.]
MIGRWLGPLALGLFCALLAWQATLAMVPRALMALAVSRVSQAGGPNRMTHAPVVTAQSRAIVRPSPDLLYSSCPFDVSKGPVLIDVATVPAPYWSLSIFDSETNVAFVRNNVEADGQPLRVAVALAGQAVPAGYRAVRVTGSRGIALVRILFDRETPVASLDRARRASRCMAGAG